MTTYTWTDNAMRSGTTCDVDKVADNLMHLKYDTSGGVCKFNNLGSISSNFTLTANYITTGDVSGNYTLTLPTVTDTEKQVVCVFDFTTTSASSPTITNTNLKWNKNNNGQAPSSYSTVSGVRNILTFKSVWISGTLYWEAEYTNYGGIETIFAQPTLTANGTLGGTSFGVAASSENGGAAYLAFDNSITTAWVVNSFSSGLWLKFYNPTALKIVSLDFTNAAYNGNCILGTGTIYGSNDDTLYTTLQSFTNSNTTNNAIWNVAISTANQDFYKYYKIIFTSSIGSYGISLAALGIHATYITT